MKGDEIVRACDRHCSKTVTLRKHVTKDEHRRKWMFEFLSKSESRDNKIARANSIRSFWRIGFRSFRSSKLECSRHESCVFRICSRINNAFYRHTQDTTVHFMTVSLTLWLVYGQLTIKQSLSLLVMQMLIALSGWSLPLLLNGTDLMLLIFEMCQVLSMQLVRCPTHIAGNRLDFVMTDVPDIVDVFVGTPLGTSDRCFVSCVLRVEQSVPE